MKLRRILVAMLAFITAIGPVSAAGAEKNKISVATFTIGKDNGVKAAINKWLAKNDVYIDGVKVNVSYEEITKARIAAGKLSRYDLLLVTGGDGDSAAAAMGPDGGAAIEAYIAAGGGYMGLGGGAFAAPLGYTPETEYLEIINLKVDYPALNHGEGQLIVKPNGGTVITDGMQTGKNYVAYGINPPALSPGDSTDPNMGAVTNAVEFVSNPINNLEAGQTGIDMTGTPAVAAAGYGSGRVVISGIQPQIEKYQPAEMNSLLGRMLIYAAGADEISVVPKEQKNKPGIVGEWLWSSTVYNLGADGAEKIVNTYADVGITDIYLLVKGTNGTVYYAKEDADNPSGAPKAYTDRDVLEEVVAAAHAKGIRVHAWITSANDRAYKTAHKDEGRYQFIRGRDDDPVANYNISFLSENFIDYSRRVAAEIARNYDVDGLHFDCIRYNHAGNGWGPEDRAMLTKPAGGSGLDKGYGLTQEEYNELVVDLAKTFGYSIAKNADGYYEYSADTNASDYAAFKADNKSLFKAYADGKTGAAAFVRMRCDLVENYASEVTAAARAVNPSLIISAALMPEGAYKDNYNVSGSNSSSFALVHYGQSYASAPALYDYICPMLYTSDFGSSSQWAASLIKNAIDAGNTVVAGLQAYNPATSFDLKQDIEAIQAIHSHMLKGITLFRNGMLNYVVTAVNKKSNTISVRLINARDSDYPLGYAKIDLLGDLTATKITELSGGLEGASTEITADGKSVIVSGFNLPYGNHDGTITFTYSGKADKKQDATFTVSSAELGATDVRNYQITLWK